MAGSIGLMGMRWNGFPDTGPNTGIIGSMAIMFALIIATAIGNVTIATITVIAAKRYLSDGDPPRLNAGWTLDNYSDRGWRG